MMTENLGKISITPKGQWIAGTYERLDLVTDNGSSYLSLKDNNVSALDTADWMVVAEKGKAFEYSDFTPEQIALLQKPASDIATTVSNAEELRVTAETNRNNAEGLRLSAEIGRENAESNRVEAETARSSAETARVSSETARETAEGLRVSAETSRGNAETIRISSENDRVSAENIRVDSEEDRVTAENVRVSAETSRGNAETVRVNSESGRVSAETARVSAEANRNNAEGLRLSAEIIRNDNEADRIEDEGLRQQAELNRQTDTSTAISNAEQATGKANDAAILANEKAGLANEKAGLAATATTQANAARDGANNAAQSATNLVNSYATDLAAKELKANKQNSLAVDGTGTKFPTVDAVNEGLGNKISKLPFTTLVISENKEVYISSIDVATSTFISNNHGLINNQNVYPVFQDNLGAVIAGSVLPGGMQSLKVYPGYYVINVTTNTFQLSNSSAGTPIVLSENSLLDLTKWHFEVGLGGNNYTITGIPAGCKKVKLIVNGRVVRPLSPLNPIINEMTPAPIWMHVNGISYGSVGGNTWGNVRNYIEILFDSTQLLYIQARGFRVNQLSMTQNEVSVIDQHQFNFLETYKGVDIKKVGLYNGFFANGTKLELYLL